MINQPLVPKPQEVAPGGHIGADPHRRTRVYGAAAIAAYLVRKIHPTTSWVMRMKAHWQDFPALAHASSDHAGFFPDWALQDIWK